MTRDQLWNGLEKAARHPDRFVEHMEGCELLSERLIEGARHLGREVSFGGGFRLRDKVILREGESVTTVVEAVLARIHLSHEDRGARGGQPFRALHL